MPRGNGTGPSGMGPMTGRGAGFCAGYDVPGYTNAAAGGRGGFGRAGAGAGRGFRNQYYATGLTGWQRGGGGFAAYQAPPVYPVYQPSPEQELNALKSQAKMMEEDLSRAKEMISELESQKETPKK